MILEHVKDLPPQGDGFYRTQWVLTLGKKKYKEFVHDYPAVQTPIISFKQSLRRKAIEVAREKGYAVTSEDITIVEPAHAKVNMVDYATKLFTI